MLDLYKKASPDPDARAKVPILQHGDDVVVIESDVVARYVAEHLITSSGEEESSPEKKANKSLLSDEGKIEKFLGIWSTVSDGYYQALRATNEDEVTTGLDTLSVALLALEELLPDGDDGPFLCGPDFSLGECIAAPFVQRLFVSLPHFRKVDVKTYFPPKTLLWMEKVTTRPSVLETSASNESIIESTGRFFVKYVSPGTPAAATEDAAKK